MTLTEQGYPDPPGVLLDQLLGFASAEAEVRQEKEKEASRG